MTLATISAAAKTYARVIGPSQSFPGAKLNRRGALIAANPTDQISQYPRERMLPNARCDNNRIINETQFFCLSQKVFSKSPAICH
jgi:hypothetical protein